MDPIDDGLDDFTARARRERAVLALLPLFFLSGATGLAYQTLWARDLHLIFGTSTFAIATVLAAFMAGLAAGGFIMARHADRLARPLAVYGWIELGIGAYALVFPLLVSGVTPLYLSFWRAFEPSPVVFGLVQFALVGALLLVPTALMGATLPLLARFATDRLAAAGDRVGTLYAVNTAGAVFGTWLCGFFLLPIAGLWWTTVIAALANGLLGGAAIFLDQWARGSERASVVEDLPDPTFDPRGLAVAVAAGMAGFAALTYEVAWTRVLGLMLGASVYAFSLMLLAFLVGIAIGGWFGGRLSDWLLARLGQRGLLGALAVVQVGVALLSWSLLFVFPELPFLYVGVYDLVGADQSPLLLWTASMAVAVAVMTPPALLMGAAFPMAVRAVVGTSDALGGPVGRIYGFNTLGSVFGAALAGFVLLPTIAIEGTVLVGVCVNLAAAAVLLAWAAQRGARTWAFGGLGLVVATAVGLVAITLQPARVEDLHRRQLLLTAGMYKYVSDLSDHSREGILRYAVSQYDLLYYREGLSSVVTVARNKNTGNIWLANNGKVEASTTVDMPTQVLVSLLPFPFADDPRDVLVIGLASGITAGAVTQVDTVTRIDVVELEPAIEPAARFFDKQNHGVLDDPRVKLIYNDGRNHLLLSPEASYDVVISEPSNPWISGVSNLFTEDFLRMGRSRLRPGGVWSQWVQMYGMDDEDLRALLATFAEVYPHVALFMTVEDADLVVLGSDQPLEPRRERLEAALQRWPGYRSELAVVGLDDPETLLSTWQMDRTAVRTLTEGVVLNTDDNMRIEYAAPLHLHASTSDENVSLLLDSALVPPWVDEPHRLLDLGHRYLDRDDFQRGLEAALRALEAAGDPEAADAATRARRSWDDQGWEKAVVVAVGAGERLATSDVAPPGFERSWARWRVAMLQYFGEPVTPAQLVRAGLGGPRPEGLGPLGPASERD
jgi:spermidine synthase